MSSNPLHTRLCEQYGVEYPLVAFAHTKDVIAAVSRAGGIGVLGAAGLAPEEIRSAIRWIRERVGDRPFGVDLLLPASFVEGNAEDLEAQIPEGHREFVRQLQRDNQIPDPKQAERPVSGIGPEMLRRARAQLDVIFEERVPIFASALGSPAFLLERGHEVGTKIWGLIGLPRQARREIEAGVDVVIAAGSDAGGHSGSIGTFSLVPEVVRLARGTQTLVLAAGGVTTGAHLAAALALGADGVWCGTIWQATNESETEPFQREQLLRASAEDAVQSRATTGKPVRQVRSKWTEAWRQPGAPEPLPMPLQGMLVGDLQRAIKEHKIEEWQGVPAGQGVGQITTVKHASQVVYDMVEDALGTLERLRVEPVEA
jgi:NAD(P)H-dependent flavin oxidoreductase YrpB (nitropropane dioxygenase family)